MDHWCIKDECKHGTLNGSISLGSLFLAEYNQGYKAGYKDAQEDNELENKIVLAALAYYNCAMDDEICISDSRNWLFDLLRAYEGRDEGIRNIR